MWFHSKSLLTELSAKSTIRKVFDFRSSHQRCSLKKGAQRHFTKFTGKHLCQSLFLIKFVKKETLAQVFSCEFCKISKNTIFTEHLWMTASMIWKSWKYYTVWDNYYFFSWLQESTFLKWALPTRNELHWKQILNRPFNDICPGLLHATT